MRLRRVIYIPAKISIAAFYHIKKRYQCSPSDIVKSNTREVLNWFYAQDDYIAQYYLKPSWLPNVKAGSVRL